MTIDSDKTLVSKIQASCTESESDAFFTSPKVLLSTPFSELRAESGTLIHSVQLCLTTDGEIIVLKKLTDKSQKFSFLRRHKICQTDFSMHSLLCNTMLVQVPHTVLKYLYQCHEHSKTSVKDWLSKVALCKLPKRKKSPASTSTTNERKQSESSPVRSRTSSVGQSTSYQPTDESLLSYSSPTHPVPPKNIKLSENGLSPVSTPNKHGLESLKTLDRASSMLDAQAQLLDSQDRFETSLNVVQMPNGLIKARSFQGRGSVKHRFMRSNSSMSGLDEIEQGRKTPGDLKSNGSTPYTSPLPHSIMRTPSPTLTVGVNPFESRLRHTQIRNRKWKCSPRINRSSSTQVNPSNPALREVIDKYSRSASCTPTPGNTSSLATTSSTAEASDLINSQSSNSSTLPRSKKGKKSNSREERYTSTSEGAAGPTTSLLSSTKTPSRSPRILRIFHRRWQSSSAIKVPLNVDGEENRGAPVSNESSEGGVSQPSTPVKKLHQFSPKEVAEELSLMDSELLRKIVPEELENGAWMKKDSKEKLAPNVMAMVRSFNQLALLITSEILQEKTPQARAKVVSTYIQIAYKCYSNHNYNSLKAVLAGLQSTPIFRLKKTWKEVPSKKRKRFKQLSALMSECENWQLYREEINRKLASGTSFVPFLGMFLTQVVQMESYTQVRQDRQASTSPTDTSSKALSVPDDVKRRRSSSLGDCAVHSTTSSSLSKTSSIQINENSPSVHLDVVQTSALSVSAPVSPVRSPSLSKDPHSHCSCENDQDRNHSKSLSFDSSCLSPPPSLGASDEDEVDCGSSNGHDDNGSHTTDSGHHSSSSHVDYRSPLPKSSSHGNLCASKTQETSLTGSQIELSVNQIYVSLQRQSQSYESLLDAYTDDDRGLRNVVHSTLAELSRLSLSLQSLDSVFSDDESDVTTSLSHTYIDFESDLDPNTSDYGSEVNILPQDSQTTNSHIGTCSHATSNPRRALFRAQSEEVKKVCKLSPENEQCEFPPQQDELESSENSSSGGPLDEEDEKKGKRVQRSKSLSGVTKVVLRQKRSKLKSRKSVHGSDEVQSYESKTPAEMLNHYQVASLGCSMGVDMNRALRSAICDTETNTEKANYKLSVEREAHEL